MRLMPQTIAGRTVLVLLIGLTASQFVGMAIYSDDRHTALTTAGGQQIADRIAAVSQFMENQEPPARARAARSLWGPGFSVTWSLESTLEADAGDWRVGLIRSALSFYLSDVSPGQIRVAYLNPTAQGRGLDQHRQESANDPWIAMENRMRPMRMNPASRHMSRSMSHMAQIWQSGNILQVSLQLSDGSWLNFATPAQRWQPFWWSRVFLSIVLMTLTVLALSIWAVRHATRPLGVFTRAAERLGKDMNAPALDEDGPREVRRAASAFNEMQNRLRNFVQDRTQMLAAISHDLRTPITRLRLRAEFIEDAEQQKKMLADLEQMEAMISATLSFARDDSANEPRKLFDLAVLLQDLCNDAADANDSVAYEGETKFPYTGRPLALKRVFTNLIDNAVKYGVRARVALVNTDGGVTVKIRDEGPGIPEAEWDNVFSPFYRLERSRSRETGGAGLGLAVARSIVRGHGGDVTLANRDGGGLKVTVTLPHG